MVTQECAGGSGDTPENVVFEVKSEGASELESVSLLDGGKVAYPRMVGAIGEAKHSIHLEVYGFVRSGVGIEFIDALTSASSRGVAVTVVIDGWGSARDGRAVARALRRAGCAVRIHNQLRTLLLGRFGRNHRKILLVDDTVAFVGGLNISDVNITSPTKRASADLALEIRGPQCASLGSMVRHEPATPIVSSMRVYLSGRGGGWRMRRRYTRAFSHARRRIVIAHGYFLPEISVVHAIVAAARRGVEVRMLLAGQSNTLLIRAATRSLYRQLLAAGVAIHEWQGSLMHAKAAVVDGETLLIGSFNLDRLSLANLETLVEVDRLPVVARAEEWIDEHIAQSRTVGVVEASSWHWRWVFDPLGRVFARLAEALRRLIARRRS